MEMMNNGYDTNTDIIKETKVEPLRGDEIVHDESFKYDGYQVVRGEFFAHINEPSITLNNCRISLNTACLKRLPEVEYVQLLVNSEEKKLAVRPSSEDEKDSFIWCAKSEKRRPKQIICRVFYAKIVDLMGWNLDYRYKLLGKLIRSGNEYLFTFDLTSTEIYQKVFVDGEKPKTSRTPVFPKDWKNQFGLSVEEHRKRLQVDIFKGYTVFSVKNNHENTAEPPASSEALNIEEENKNDMQ